MKLNLVMIVRNEERCLKRCLEAAGPLVDGIILVDTGSTDSTKAVAASFGAHIYDYPWADDFSAARNYALRQSDGDWNLILDADEYLRPCGREELERTISAHHGRWMGALLRYDAFYDQSGISYSASLLPRLLPRGTFYQGAVHEQPGEGLVCYPVSLTADHDGYLQQGKGQRNLRILRREAQKHPDDPYYQFQLGLTCRNMNCLEEALRHLRAFYRQAGREEAYRPTGVILYLYTLLDLGAASCLEEARQVIEEEGPKLGRLADFCFVRGLFSMKLVLSDPARYFTYLPGIEESYLQCLAIGERPEDGGVVGAGSFKAAYNLGLWYEVSGQAEKALCYYRMAAEEGFAPAGERYELLKPTDGSKLPS